MSNFPELDSTAVNKLIIEIVGQSESDVQYSPSHWINQANKLNNLLYREDMIWAVLMNDIAKKRAELMTSLDENGKPYTATKAKIIIEATDEYLKAHKIELKRERAREQIRLAKKYAEMSNEELRTQI